MNKKLLILPFAAISLTLVACNNQTIVVDKGEPEVSVKKAVEAPLSVGDAVKTYLVLGPTGLYKGAAGSKIPSMFLENAIELDTTVGAALPTAEDVTSTVEGSIFQGWLTYENTGAPVSYTTAPDRENAILYASFEGGNAGTQGNTPVPPPPTDTGFGFMFKDGKKVHAVDQGEVDVYGTIYHQYYVAAMNFTAGEEFQLYDFENSAGWVVDLDGYSFGGKGDTTWQQYLTKGSNYYTVNKDFKAEAYLKLKMNQDNIYFGLK